MSLKDAVIAQLKIDEGNKTHPYQDMRGITTIGIGRNLDAIGLRQSEIDFMVSNDYDECIILLDHYFSWWQAMDDVRKEVLINMCFNMGIQTLSKFTNTLDAMQNGHYDFAGRDMRASAWYHQVGARAERLAVQMETGIKQ